MSSKYDALDASEDAFEDQGMLSMMRPARGRTLASSICMLICAFACCLASVGFGFYIGTSGQVSALVSSKVNATTGLGMATIDELPFVTDGN